MDAQKKAAAIELLNRIMEAELSGVVRYTHYSLMVYGPARIPIVGWLREQAGESLAHAQRAGELVTLLGGHPSLAIGALLETHQHEIDAIMRESLDHEQATRALYYKLLALSEGSSVLLEEYARELIMEEELHADEVNKMLRQPGETSPYPH